MGDRCSLSLDVHRDDVLKAQAAFEGDLHYEGGGNFEEGEAGYPTFERMKGLAEDGMRFVFSSGPGREYDAQIGYADQGKYEDWDSGVNGGLLLDGITQEEFAKVSAFADARARMKAHVDASWVAEDEPKPWPEVKFWYGFEQAATSGYDAWSYSVDQFAGIYFDTALKAAEALRKVLGEMGFETQSPVGFPGGVNGWIQGVLAHGVKPCK